MQAAGRRVVVRVACRLGLGLAVVLVGPAAAAEVEGPADGRIYGTVKTHAGTRATGLIRWGGQEAFWDDLFHSMKDELPYASYDQPVEEPEESEWWWQEIGKKLMRSVDRRESRPVFVARFGDIARIEVVGGNAAVVTMRSGSSYRVSGYANDVGATLTVTDPETGDVDVSWGRVDVVEFSPAPAGLTFPGYRLFGTVETTERSFAGFIQWDEDEGLSSDRLDGDDDGGRVSIPFGTIRSIEPLSAAKSRVELTDGRAMVLSGTNDVNAENRGIVVEDPRYGRVKVPWREFRRIELSRPEGSGRAYADFGGSRRLRGTVHATDGSSVAGALHVDLDDSESWEMLAGVSGGIAYDIPYAMVRSLERAEGALVVTLTGGATLRLADGEGARSRRAGIVVELGDDGERFLPWREVRRVDFGEAAGQ